MLSTRVDFIFAAHKLAKFSSDPGKVHFEELVYLLIYIRYNKTLVLKYYVDMKDAPLFDLLRQANINTENQLMYFSDSNWQDYPDTSRSTGEYIIFYQGGPIDHGTHVPGPVPQSSAESGYNAACNAGIYLLCFRMLIHELLNKDPYTVSEEDPLTIWNSKSVVCMAKNGKATKHTIHISRRVYLVRNGEKFKIHKIDWYEAKMGITG